MTDYVIHEDICFEPLETIDIPRLLDECTDPWFNQSLCRVDASVVRLGVLQGEFHFHKHDREDEFFLVLDGTLWIDLEDRTIELGKNQGVVIPKGIAHRPRAPEKVVVVMVEAGSVRPTGDT